MPRVLVKKLSAQWVITLGTLIFAVPVIVKVAPLAVDTDGRKRLEQISDILGVNVYLHESTTGGATGIIYLQSKYASLLEPVKYRRLRKGKQAIAIFLLLHEYRHTQQGPNYKYPSYEDNANHWATEHFRWFCLRRFRFTQEQTHALWSSLPIQYRDMQSSII